MRWAALLLLPTVAGLAVSSAWTLSVDPSLVYLGNGARPIEQARSCALRPGACGAAFASTLFKQLGSNLQSFVGAFTWIDPALGKRASQVFGAGLVLVALVSRSGWRPWQRGVLLGVVAITTAAVEVPLYLTYTPVGWPAVLGLQGRYFIPPAWFLWGAIGAFPSAWRGGWPRAALTLALLLPAAWVVHLLADAL